MNYSILSHMQSLVPYHMTMVVYNEITGMSLMHLALVGSLLFLLPVKYS